MSYVLKNIESRIAAAAAAAAAAPPAHVKEVRLVGL